MSRKKKENVTVDALKMISKGIKDIIPVDEMPDEVIIPSISTGFNRASGAGGIPSGCIIIIEGPNQVGKTALALILMESFRRAGYFSAIYDSEFAAEKTWYSSISPDSGYKRTGSINEVRNDIALMLKNLAALKKDGKIDEAIGCAYLIDSMTQLMPDEWIAKIEKEGIEKSFPLQAMFVSLWAREIVPKLWRSNSSMIVVLQERIKMGATGNQKKYQATMGKSIQYNNRLRIRVGWSKAVTTGSKENKVTVGMECFCKVENNKITGTSLEKFSFFTSNGKGDCPKGLDLVREAIEEAKTSGNLKERTTDKKKYLVAEFNGKELFRTKDGQKHVRDLLTEDKKLFNQFVKKLNERG